MCLLSPYPCFTTWETAADVNTIHPSIHPSSMLIQNNECSLAFPQTLTNTQTSWSVMRIKNVRAQTFCSLNSVYFFFFLLLLCLFVLHFTPASWKWQKGRQECEGEGRSKIGWLSCEMLILWTKTTTVAMRTQIQSVVLPAEDNNRGEKQKRSSKEVGRSQSCICFTRKSEQEKQHSPGYSKRGVHTTIGMSV